ncbi:polysaccharide lyase family 1 protein [Treponema sp.]|uniref:pectate lyase family protein n=1 Tax=Treponema sp. TaxID=166 RepID=UPI003890C688
MKKIPLIFTSLLFSSSLILAAPSTLTVKKSEKPVTNGWADNGSLSYASSNTIIISDETYPSASEKLKAFTNAIASGSVTNPNLTDTPAFIILSGTVDLSGGKVSDSDHSYFDEFDPATHQRKHKDFMYNIGSNKTIIGTKDAKVAYGGLKIKAEEHGRKNIIIRNINFWDAHGSTEYDTKVSQYMDKKASADQLVIEGVEDKSTKSRYLYIPEDIWIDHCTFSDGICVDLDRNYNHDGALDIKCARNVTISYCEFTNHDKVTLSGSSDKFTDPSEREVTFHNNYYHGCVQRMPRTRAGYFHLYNNVYEDIGTSKNSGASLGPGIGAQFIVENNFFGKHAGKILKAADSSKSGSETFYKIYASGNSPELSSSNSEGFASHRVTKKPWEIPYKYTLENAVKAHFNVIEQAGSGAEVSIE